MLLENNFINLYTRIRKLFIIYGSLTLVIEDLLFKGLKSLNFFVKF